MLHLINYMIATETSSATQDVAFNYREVTTAPIYFSHLHLNSDQTTLYAVTSCDTQTHEAAMYIFDLENNSGLIMGRPSSIRKVKLFPNALKMHGFNVLATVNEMNLLD